MDSKYLFDNFDRSNVLSEAIDKLVLRCIYDVLRLVPSHLEKVLSQCAQIDYIKTSKIYSLRFCAPPGPTLSISNIILDGHHDEKN